MNILLVNIFGDCLIFETEVISVCAMTFRCCAHNLALSRIQVVWVCILLRHVLAQPGVRKVEGSAPWAVGSATRAWNFCGVHSVTKVENLWSVEISNTLKSVIFIAELRHGIARSIKVCSVDCRFESRTRITRT